MKKQARVYNVILQVWLLGFAADAVGVAWMFFGAMLTTPFEDIWEDTLRYTMHDPFGHLAAFLWTLAVVIAPWLFFVPTY